VGDRRLHNPNTVGDRGKALRSRESLSRSGQNGLSLTDSTAVGNVSNCTAVLYATPVKEDRVLLNYVNEWISAYIFLACK
jgi:hypothetical protein